MGVEDYREKRKRREGKNPTRLIKSAFLNEVRTYFEQKFYLQAENPHTKK